MFSLGQAVIYKNFKSDPPTPAILIGLNQYDSPIIAMVDKNGVLIRSKQACSMDLSHVRQKNTKSPSGKSIYYGAFCKKGFLAKVTIKLPDEAALVKELKKINTLIQEES